VPVATVAADVTGYSDGGLPPSSTFHYRVRAFNAEGSSGASEVASAATFGATTSDALASGESTIDGVVAAGTLVDTHAADGVAQELRESRSGATPATRVSALEHEWTLPVAPGTSVELHVLAHHTLNGEGDDFVFSWSSDGVVFTDVLTLTAIAPGGPPVVAALPPSLSGAVTIRVRDADRTPGNGRRDSLFVDQLFVRTQ